MTKIVSMNLGPAALASPQFQIASPGMLKVQAFVIASLALPTSLALLEAVLPAKPSGGFTQFQDLVDGYKALHDSCEVFNNTTFPNSVKCASNLVAYNMKVPKFYRAIASELAKLIDDPKTPEELAANAKVQKSVNALCDNLTKDATAYETHAQKVFDDINAFYTETQVNKAAVERLSKKYTEQLTSKGGSINDLNERLKKDKQELEEAQKEYEHDVIVAATTATYCWIFPYGTIAAGIVAGIYGDKAVKIKAKIEAFRQLIAEMESTLQADTNLLLDLTRITVDLKQIDDKVKAALPVIAEIKGMWGSLKDSISSIKRTITEGIEDQEKIIADLEIETAIDTWKIIGDKAEAYRLSAYITVVNEGDLDAAEEAGRKSTLLLKALINAA